MYVKRNNFLHCRNKPFLNDGNLNLFSANPISQFSNKFCCFVHNNNILLIKTMREGSSKKKIFINFCNYIMHISIIYNYFHMMKKKIMDQRHCLVCGI